ncbi:hypothetical protein [Ochrobactrum sp. EDr1-4]|uniref:hypothetical protein n=1 Tax=Ochrobactrum sp. EDr1-4 TaxID=3368622 RepID=UPI003BA262BD
MNKRKKVASYQNRLNKSLANFKRDTKGHSMTVRMDNGVHRDLKFSYNNSSTYHFNITTWPGYLCISGDMGDYVFQRLTDMFEFFRGDAINPDYWAEKIQANNRRGGYERFSFDRLKEAVKTDFDQWEVPRRKKKAAWQAIEDKLFFYMDPNDERGCIQSVMDYECSLTKQCFVDFYEHNLKEYTHHFLWCCFAIQWAIKQYDAIHPTGGSYEK